MTMYTFHYQLQYQEAYETFYLLASKRSRRTNRLIGICLTVITAVLLLLYGLDSRKIHYLFLAFISILLLFYLIYSPVLKARKGATAVDRQHGYYKAGFSEDGAITLPSSEPLRLSEDPHSRVIETETIFAIRADREHTICLPKRILEETQERDLREHFRKYAHSYQGL